MDCIWMLVLFLVSLQKTMDYLEYKGYKGSIEYSKADNCLVGKVLGMGRDMILFEGQNIGELYDDFCNGVDSYIEGYKEDGIEPKKPYSGKLVLRMPSDMHERVAFAAAAEGATINDYINRAITRELSFA